MPIYAVIRALGRSGLADLIARCCARASRIAARLRTEPGVEVLNDIVLNQVLVRFQSPGGNNVTPLVIARVQEDGTCWVGGTKWRGKAAMRVSISNWSTTPADIERSAAAILSALDRVIGPAPTA